MTEADDTAPTSKKPPGWYSSAARAEREAARLEKRRKKAAAERARARRKAERQKRAEEMVKASARRMAPYVLAEAIAKAKAPPPKKKPGKSGAKKPPPIMTRAFDNVTEMARRGHLDNGQEEAARRYREAFEAVSSQGLKSTLNTAGAGGGASSSGGPGTRVMVLAGDLNQADQLLGTLDGMLVQEIVGKGVTVEEYARSRYGAGRDGRAARKHLDRVRGRLAEALSLLAVAWHITRSGRSRIVAHRSPGAVPGDDQNAFVERATVAHAAPGKKVAYGKAASPGRKSARS